MTGWECNITVIAVPLFLVLKKTTLNRNQLVVCYNELPEITSTSSENKCLEVQTWGTRKTSKEVASRRNDKTRGKPGSVPGKNDG
jgi:hypothetical protein